MNGDWDSLGDLTGNAPPPMLLMRAMLLIDLLGFFFSFCDIFYLVAHRDGMLDAINKKSSLHAIVAV